MLLLYFYHVYILLWEKCEYGTDVNVTPVLLECLRKILCWSVIYH